MSWWVGELARSGEYAQLVSWIFWVLAAITLHELSHGWAAIWQGDRTPIETGHMTANPLVHMGPMSLLLFALCGIAWGVMPVNPHRFRSGRMGGVYVSAAGPLVNVILAVISFITLVAWLRFGPVTGNLGRNVAMFFFIGCSLNILLAILNLLPIPPLDGSRILGGLSRRAERLFANEQAVIIGSFLFILIFFLSPIGSLLFGFGFAVTIIGADIVSGAVGGPSALDVIWG